MQRQTCKGCTESKNKKKRPNPVNHDIISFRISNEKHIAGKSSSTLYFHFHLRTRPGPPWYCNPIQIQTKSKGYMKT